MSVTPKGHNSDHKNTLHDNTNSYQNNHKPSSEFNTRDEYLEHELQIMQPKRAGGLIYLLETTALNLKTRFQPWRALLVKWLW